MKRTILYCLLLLSLSTCRELVDLDIDRRLGQLVVFGHVDNSDDELFLQISRTSDLPYQYLPEIGARPTLLDDQGNEGIYQRTVEDGIFIYDRSSMRIIPGRSYTLRVRTANGQVYESQPEKIPTIRAVPEVSVEFKQVPINAGSAGSIVTQNVMDIFTTTTLNTPGQKYYIRWQTIQTFRLNPTDFPDPFNSIPASCYVNRSVQPQLLPLFNTENFNGSVVPRTFLGRVEIDYAFNNKNIISVKAFSQTREAYEFYRKAGITLNNTGSIFDIPAAAIPGNINNVENESEEILGFFDAALVEIQRIQVTRNDFPFRVPVTGCQFTIGKSTADYPDYCIDCTILEGSSYGRPSFY